MKIIRNVIIAMILIGIVMSCSYSAERADIIGSWKCYVDYTNMHGEEWRTYKEDSSVSVIDSLSYFIEEDSLKIDVKCCIANCGRWTLKDNEIELSVKSVTVDIDSSSLKISTDSQVYSIDSLSSSYLKFKQELCEQIKADIFARFKTDINREIKIGKIVECSDDMLVIENSSGKLILERCP